MRREILKLGRETREELADAYIELQSELEQQGRLPRPPQTLLDKHHELLVTLGAVNLGLVVAAVSIFLNFLIVNFLLHLPPS